MGIISDNQHNSHWIQLRWLSPSVQIYQENSLDGVIRSLESSPDKLDISQTHHREDPIKIMRSVELFAGAGGLALGIARAGFHHEALVEADKHACATIRRNQTRIRTIANSSNLYEIDASHFDYKAIRGEIDLLAGGPPCQPFSRGGKHRGAKDTRNMFPEMLRAALELRPKAILIENVSGLSRPAFTDYFNYIRLQIQYPELNQRNSESWVDHYQRIKKHIKSHQINGLTYQVFHRLLNAADYGVPQNRQRIFIVAFRSDLNVQWDFPNQTHSIYPLLYDQWITGEYWNRHNIGIRNRVSNSEKYSMHIESYLDDEHNNYLPWRTVRDAIMDLPNPLDKKDSRKYPNHIYNPGARSYPGHTGSRIDFPAKTLKAGTHGVPGGENMLAHSNGKVRYFTVRESARLQTFPDNYVFPDVWSTAMKQLGNAVPVKLAEILARSIITSLHNSYKLRDINNVQTPLLQSLELGFAPATARTTG